MALCEAGNYRRTLPPLSLLHLILRPVSAALDGLPFLSSLTASVLSVCAAELL